MISAVFRDTVSRETSGDLAFCMGKPSGFQVHHVIPFKDIIQDFIRVYNIDMNEVEIEQDPVTRKYILMDNVLRRRLLEYCRQFAVLRLLSIPDHKIETKKREWVHTR